MKFQTATSILRLHAQLQLSKLSQCPMLGVDVSENTLMTMSTQLQPHNAPIT
ncbi:MAG TPA: hypothetical protein VJ249_07085 [Candidatus Bathyarchaeia archaeon]|nr:hypothetical protein [Candidatus Bathyarchaeia archaeon]